MLVSTEFLEGVRLREDPEAAANRYDTRDCRTLSDFRIGLTLMGVVAAAVRGAAAHLTFSKLVCFF